MSDRQSIAAGLLCSLVLIAAGPQPASPQAGAAADLAGNEFDCVIEPKTLIKLGSPDIGVVEAVHVDRNQMVRKGEVVARLESSIQRTAVELARLKASNDVQIKSERVRFGYRKLEADRAETLHNREFASTKSRDEAVSEKQLAELALNKAELEHRMAQVELEDALVRLDRRSVRSPVNGVVADVTARPGEYVNDQLPLMTIAEIDPLYVKVFLPVRYYGAVLVESVAQVMPEQPIGGTHEAKVTVVDRVFDAASSTFAVRLEIPNSQFVLPAGLRCRVHFHGPLSVQASKTTNP